MKKLNSRVNYRKITSAEEFAQFINDCIPKDDFYLIKPNWFDPRPGSYTDAETLDIVLSALKGQKIVVEGHSHSRNDLSIKITPENSDKKRDWIREQEKKYLEKLGIRQVLDKHQVEYLNVTEEWWAGRTAAAEVIKEIVESSYAPIKHPELYGFIPQKLYDLRGKTLVDLAKIKMTSPSCRDFSLTMKNLFGLLPQPSRIKYHDNLPQSIVDVNKVYRALFNVIGLCEGIRQAVIFWEGGKFSTPWSHFDVVENLGIAVCGNELVDLDVFLGRLFNQDLTERTLVGLAQEAFGKVDETELAQADILLDLAAYLPVKNH